MKSKAAYITDKLKEIDKKLFYFGYVIPILYSLFCIIFYVYDETSDDTGTAWDLSQTGHATNYRINKWLALFVRFLDITILRVSWWPIILMIANTITLVMLCRILVKKVKPLWLLTAIFFIMAVTSNLTIYSGANFTRTSTMLILISVYYVIDSVQKGEIKSKEFIIGCLAFVLGAGIRINCVFFGVGMGGGSIIF